MRNIVNPSLFFLKWLSVSGSFTHHCLHSRDSKKSRAGKHLLARMAKVYSGTVANSSKVPSSRQILSMNLPSAKVFSIIYFGLNLVRKCETQQTNCTNTIHSWNVTTFFFNHVSLSSGACLKKKKPLRQRSASGIKSKYKTLYPHCVDAVSLKIQKMRIPFEAVDKGWNLIF